MSRDTLYLKHLLDAIEKVERYAAVGHAEFMVGSHWQDAVIRQLEIIGEAVKRISRRAARTTSGPSMRAVDTNVLVRLLTGDDGDQTPAAEVYAAAGLWVSHLALVECVWVLKSTYQIPRTRIVEAIEGLLDHEALALQEPEVVAAALARFREHARLEFSDCMVLETARKSGHLPLGTFDRALAKQDGAELI